MRAHRLLLLSALSLALLFVFASSNDANAIPAFARKYEKPCSTCHTAWPMLNATGRAFKENGFRRSRVEEVEEAISDFLAWDRSFPVAALVKSRPYDKRETGDEKLRAIHEVEVFAAGVLARDFSGFFELEAEDEADFEVEVGSAFVGYHPADFFNIVFAWDDIFSADPYDTIADRRITRGRNIVIDNRFGGADNNGRIRDNHQSVIVYGRPVDELYYSVGVHGPGRDSEGVNPGTFSGRLALQAIPELMIGGFGITGECETSASNCSRDRDFSRVGADFVAEYENARLQGAWLTAHDDLDASGDADNDAFFIEGLYAVPWNERPWIVPLIRFDWFETNDGADEVSTITLHLDYYIYENVKIFAEWFKELDDESDNDEDGRFTIQAEIGF